MKALDETARAPACNALVVFLGNFGPEGPETLLAKKFGGPVMFVAAAEENGDVLDRATGATPTAACSTARYNLGLRGVQRRIFPSTRWARAEDMAEMIAEFVPVARAHPGPAKPQGHHLRPAARMISWPATRPSRPLYDLGVDVRGKLASWICWWPTRRMTDDPRIPDVMADMADELGAGQPVCLASCRRLAQYELTLLDWAEAAQGRRASMWPLPTSAGRPSRPSSALCPAMSTAA